MCAPRWACPRRWPARADGLLGAPSGRRHLQDALWTTVKATAAARAAGRTKQRYRGLDAAPRYISPTLTSQRGHDYSFKTGHQVSVLTLDGRVIVPYTGDDRHVALLQQGAQGGGRIGAANLWYDRPRTQFYLLVSLAIDVADP